MHLSEGKMSDIYIGRLVSSNALEHHGILGMKWGVRKDQSSGSRLRTAAKIASPVGYAIGKGSVKAARAIGKTGTKAANRAKQGKEKWDAGRPARIEKKRQKALSVTSSARYTYKQRKHLSDAELRSRINRLNMEGQLKDLSRSDRRSPDFTMISTGRHAAKKALGMYGAKVAVTAAFGKEAGAFIKPKK